MNAIRGITLTVWNSALVTTAVILGFIVGGAFKIPIWLQGFFLLPAAFLFCRLSGAHRPSFWKLVGFVVLLSAFVLMFHLGSRLVPERYFWIYYFLIVMVFPFGPIARWCERRFNRRTDQSESGPRE